MIRVVVFIVIACEIADKSVTGTLSIQPPYNPFWVLEGTPFSVTCVKEASTRVPLAWNVNGMDMKTMADRGYSIKNTTVKMDQRIVRTSSQLTKELTVADSDEFGPAFVICEAVGVNTPDGDKDQITISVYIFSVFTEHPNISEGYDVSLKCNPEYIEANVTWSRDGKMITNSTERRMLEDRNRTLVIRKSRPQDAGVYQCTMHMDTCKCSEEQTFTRNVHVSGKPYLKNDTARHVDVTMNGTLTLTCPVSGFPLPEVYWLRGGGSDSPVEPSPRVTLSAYNGVRHALLRIKGLTKEDFGLYECVAQNSVGRLVKEFEVAVADGDSPTIASSCVVFSRALLCACLAVILGWSLCRNI